MTKAKARTKLAKQLVLKLLVSNTLQTMQEGVCVDRSTIYEKEHHYSNVQLNHAKYVLEYEWRATLHI